MLTGSGEVGRETVIGIENLVLSPLLTPILELSPILPLLRVVTLGSAPGLNKFGS